MDPRYQKLIRENQDLKRQVAGLEAQITGTPIYSGYIGIIRMSENEYDSLESKYRLQEVNHNNLIAECEALRTENKSLRDDRDTIKSMYNALRAKYSDLKLEHESIVVNHSSLKTEHDILKAKCDAQTSELKRLENEVRRLNSIYTDLKFASNFLKEERDVLASDVETLANEKGVLRDEFDEYKRTHSKRNIVVHKPVDRVVSVELFNLRKEFDEYKSKYPKYVIKEIRDYKLDHKYNALVREHKALLSTLKTARWHNVFAAANSLGK